MTDLSQYKFLALGLFLVFFLVAERLMPVARAGKGRQRLFVNAGLWASVLPVSALFVVPLSLWASGNPLWQRPDWWSGWSGLLIDLLILDLWIYWMHRGFHEVPVLWRFHEIHHRDETLDASSAVRFHFGEVMISASVRLFVIIALAVPFSSVILFETVAALAAIFQHSNVRLPRFLERALSWVIVTPSIHWIHHHVTKEDTNSNYCNIFSWWDLLFRTRSTTVRTSDMPIGLDYTKDLSLVNLWLQPFRKREH
ncbi:sterol desaturase family protein [Parvularcula sp. IMCC14364]|uniref:sterol desaturase family protein n=1 Tax=Parvularcula sp. IMCC14364 TaxID=3067902 RepID=UPI002740D9EC|nr:sterol desaturase family protein [Parvularcula sp. IMCC14364]